MLGGQIVPDGSARPTASGMLPSLHYYELSGWWATGATPLRYVNQDGAISSALVEATMSDLFATYNDSTGTYEATLNTVWAHRTYRMVHDPNWLVINGEYVYVPEGGLERDFRRYFGRRRSVFDGGVVPGSF